MKKEKLKHIAKRITAFAAAAAMAAAFTFPAEVGDGIFDGFGNAIVASAEAYTAEYDIAAGNVTIDANGTYRIYGSTDTNTVTVAKGVSANITLDNVNINVSGTRNACAFKIEDDSIGNVTIDLVGENTLKSGIYCAGLQKNGSGESIGKLTIKSTSGTGKLTAAGGWGGAGIGGGSEGTGSDITISGGTVTATGGSDGAGIGGGKRGYGTDITISGGTVTATGGKDSAGIGGGYIGTGLNITISGGTVTANGGDYGAGIGGGIGTGSNITISGGTVTATGGLYGAGIGGGSDGGSGSNITISGGTVTATGGEDGAGIGGGDKGTGLNITISGGTVTANGGKYGAGIGGGFSGYGSNITISGGAVTAAGGEDGAGIGGGRKGSGSNITISGGSVYAKGGYYSDFIAADIGGGCDSLSNGVPVTPTDGTESVYLREIENHKGAAITINGISYPTNHNGEEKIYAYLPAKTAADPNEIKVGNTTTYWYYDTANSDWIEGTNAVRHTITASAGANGSISPSGSVPVVENSDQTFVITPDSGYEIGTLTVDGSTVTADTSYTFRNVTEDHTISVTFKRIKYQLTVTNGSGSGSYEEGTLVTITADTLGIEKKFKEWTVVSGNVTLADPTSSTTTFTMPASSVEVTATYSDNFETAGDLKVIGGTKGTDYSYESNVLTVKTETPLTVSGTTTTDRIEVAEGVSANITLAGLSIDVSATDYACAFRIADDSTGSVTITLAEGTENTLRSGKNCAGLEKNGSNGSLEIKGTGKLTAAGGQCGAGIGGGDKGSGSNITISGGTVTATGGISGAGIGGGDKGSGSDITINGGTVTATGGGSGAGIGGGYNGSGSGITISDGTVDATGGVNGAGIGGGDGDSGSDITISGGNVTANGGENGAGIGGGNEGSGSDITISGGNVTANGGTFGAGIGGAYSSGSDITISGGTVIANGGNGGAGIGGGFTGSGSNITIIGGTVIANGGNVGAGIGGGFTGSGSNIIISGGTVTANGGDDGGAGIGNGSAYEINYDSVSNITIIGGSVYAKGGVYTYEAINCCGADIGTGMFGDGEGQQYSNGVPVTPTNGTDYVYLREIENPTGAAIAVNGKAYPTNHSGEAKIYAYLPAKSVSDPNEVTVGDTTTYCYYDTASSRWADVNINVNDGDDIENFVERLYLHILGRASDPEGKANHVSNLRNGETAVKVSFDFVFSSEFAELPISNEERVRRMYLTFLDRSADDAGLADWTATLDNGCSIGHIFYGFTQSGEFTELCEKYGIVRGDWTVTETRDVSSKLTAFVSRLYIKALNRSYDVDGLNNHTANYMENHDLYQLAYDFIFSPEFTGKDLSDEDFVDTMYRTFFDREGDPAGKADWLGRMKSGCSREEVLAGFVGSQECAELVAKFGI